MILDEWQIFPFQGDSNFFSGIGATLDLEGKITVELDGTYYIEYSIPVSVDTTEDSITTWYTRICYTTPTTPNQSTITIAHEINKPILAPVLARAHFNMSASDTGVYTDLSSDVGFKVRGFEVGQSIDITGFTNSGNNGSKVILAVTDDTITTDPTGMANEVPDPLDVDFATDYPNLIIIIQTIGQTVSSGTMNDGWNALIRAGHKVWVETKVSIEGGTVTDAPIGGSEAFFVGNRGGDI